MLVGIRRGIQDVLYFTDCVLCSLGPRHAEILVDCWYEEGWRRQACYDMYLAIVFVATITGKTGEREIFSAATQVCDWCCQAAWSKNGWTTW